MLTLNSLPVGPQSGPADMRNTVRLGGNEGDTSLALDTVAGMTQRHLLGLCWVT